MAKVETSAAHLALRNAVTLYRQPVQARSLERQALPEGIAQLLRIAAEGEATAAQFSAGAGSTPSELHAATIFYLQTIVFHHSASDPRLLALSIPIDKARLKEHKRLILKWLHPDRNHNSWESKLFLRVQAAATRLENALKNGRSIEGPTYNSRRSVRRLRHNLRVEEKRSWSPGLVVLLVGRGAIKLYFILGLLGAGMALLFFLTHDEYIASFFGGAGN